MMIERQHNTGMTKMTTMTIIATHTFPDHWGADLCWDTKRGEYFVMEYNDFGDPIDQLPVDGLPPHRDDETAKAAYRRWIEEVSPEDDARPDWEAQAAYDELHGTINAEDPGIALWREMTAGEH